MTNTRLPRLSHPGVLESIAPHRLASLLHPYAAFFEGRNVTLNATAPIDCQAVIRAVMEADRDTPAELLEAICLIDELANEPTVDLLLSRVTAEELGLEPNGQHSAADILVAAWLNHREQLVQTQAQTRFKRARSFDYYQSNQSKPPKFTMPSDATIRQLEQDIDSWFVERYRGRGTKVEIFDNGFEVKVHLAGRKADLAVTIRPPNVAIYNRGPAASIIEAWLTQRGFIISGQSGRKVRHEPALASA